MATTAHTLNTSTWTAISAAGNSGACWLKTGGGCYNDHSTSGSTACAISKSYFMLGENDIGNTQEKIVNLVADSVADIFYAIAITSTNTNAVILIADVI